MAKRQENRQGSAGYLVDEVVVHCSPTGASCYAGRKSSDKVAEIRRWHVVDRGWKDIGYHWLIDTDDTVLPGRAETVSLARARQDIERASVTVDTYKAASETAVRQAAALDASREAAEADRRSTENWGRAAEDACLDQPLPAGLLD